jgi:hypothetical protein
VLSDGVCAASEELEPVKDDRNQGEDRRYQPGGASDGHRKNRSRLGSLITRIRLMGGLRRSVWH